MNNCASRQQDQEGMVRLEQRIVIRDEDEDVIPGAPEHHDAHEREGPQLVGNIESRRVIKESLDLLSRRIDVAVFMSFLTFIGLLMTLAVYVISYILMHKGFTEGHEIASLILIIVALLFNVALIRDILNPCQRILRSRIIRAIILENLNVKISIDGEGRVSVVRNVDNDRSDVNSHARGPAVMNNV